MDALVHDPDSVLSYGFDWATGGTNDGGPNDIGWLQGATIASSTWSITGPDSVLQVDSDTNDTTQTSAVVSGGTVDLDYTLTNHIVASNGLEDDMSYLIRVRQK